MKNRNRRDIEVGTQVILNHIVFRRWKGGIVVVKENTETHITFSQENGEDILFQKDHIYPERPEFNNRLEDCPFDLFYTND